MVERANNQITGRDLLSLFPMRFRCGFIIIIQDSPCLFITKETRIARDEQLQEISSYSPGPLRVGFVYEQTSRVCGCCAVGGASTRAEMRTDEIHLEKWLE